MAPFGCGHAALKNCTNPSIGRTTWSSYNGPVGAIQDAPVSAEDIHRRIDERNAEDSRRARLLIGLGIPSGVAGTFFLAAALGGLLWVAPVGLSAAPAFGLAAVIVDVWRHPSEHWAPVRFYLKSGEVSGAEFMPAALGTGFHGMPLMANVTDPDNLAALERAQRVGCANVVLGGPRNVRKGIDLRLRIRRRRDAKVRASAVAFATWLAGEGPLSEAALEFHMKERPDRVTGFLLVSDLGLLSVKRTGAGKLYAWRPRIESDTPPPR